MCHPGLLMSVICSIFVGAEEPLRDGAMRGGRGITLNILDMKPRFYLVAALLLCMWLPSAAQESRSYIKGAYQEWGSCRNVAITLTGRRSGA